ncbi:DUF6638 family protein [Rhizobium sp. L1K21]|uniref:DUF6638 family protein n=1 Tax=Rhizobium sp. L1K21 TaxID=2954933 RepID=UPI002093AC06|nr:DUF6638 family protein [Rhizobium sp. L1K21]MCO6185386.1 hypothetical protein [Rhizobium sp. L1K21]
MQRLLEAELIYGRLLTISEPHLVERYNKAMKGFGLPETRLSEFEIDMTGFSPQVASELNDKDYLDPLKVNRRFIIMTPDQENLPVVHTSFSNTAGLMHEFYEANARAISAVTIRDALYGEIEDSVAKVDTLEDLLKINEVSFRVLSAEDILSRAAELRGLVDRLKAEPDAWRDDAMLNRMVELAKKTGDIRENKLVPDQLVFRHESYWANHFGGVYIFHEGRDATVICDKDAPGFRRSRPWQVSYIPIDDHKRVFEFLMRSGRIELPRGSWAAATGLLQHRANMTLEGLIRETVADADFKASDPIWRQTWLSRHVGLVAEEGSYPFLQDLSRKLAQTGQANINDIPHKWRFLAVRAKPDHPDFWLVGRLIAQLTPRDYVSRFVFDKQGFYDSYEHFGEMFREHVVSTLADTYLKDKKTFRQRLYGIGGPTHA